MIKLWVSIVAIVWLTVLAAPATAGSRGPSRDNLTTPPLDSAEAERVRIWLPIERHSNCRVTIDILGDSAQVIRRLVDRLFSYGYYNFYWDKKDDSGEFVTPGSYGYVVNDCGRKYYREVTAQFSRWELSSRVYSPAEPWSTVIDFELSRDSALVSINVCNRRGRVIDTPIVDSLMNSGRHRFDWIPPTGITRGVYTVNLIIGDFSYTIDIRYKP